MLLGDVKMAYGTVRTVCMAFTSVCDFQLIPGIIFHWSFARKDTEYAIMDSPHNGRGLGLRLAKNVRLMSLYRIVHFSCCTIKTSIKWRLIDG